jgi:hypothetical protein
MAFWRRGRVQQWEYLYAHFIWDDDVNDWFFALGGQSPEVGLERILDRVGSEGWELIGFAPSRWRVGSFLHPKLATLPTGAREEGGDMIVYLALFKRPKQ